MVVHRRLEPFILLGAEQHHHQGRHHTQADFTGGQHNQQKHQLPELRKVRRRYDLLGNVPGRDWHHQSDQGGDQPRCHNQCQNGFRCREHKFQQCFFRFSARRERFIETISLLRKKRGGFPVKRIFSVSMRRISITASVGAEIQNHRRIVLPPERQHWTRRLFVVVLRQFNSADAPSGESGKLLQTLPRWALSILHQLRFLLKRQTVALCNLPESGGKNIRLILAIPAGGTNSRKTAQVIQLPLQRIGCQFPVFPIQLKPSFFLHVQCFNQSSQEPRYILPFHPRSCNFTDCGLQTIMPFIGRHFG